MATLLKWQLSSISALFHFKRQQAASMVSYSHADLPFPVLKIPGGATVLLLHFKRQVVSRIPCASIHAVTVRQLSARTFIQRSVQGLSIQGSNNYRAGLLLASFLAAGDSRLLLAEHADLRFKLRPPFALLERDVPRRLQRS